MDTLSAETNQPFSYCLFFSNWGQLLKEKNRFSSSFFPFKAGLRLEGRRRPGDSQKLK